MHTPATSAPSRATYRHARWIAPLVLSLTGSGCSHLDVPLAHNYPASGQPKARSAHHWDVMATDVAQRIARGLGETPVLRPVQPHGTEGTAPAQPTPAAGTLRQLRWRLAPAPATAFNRAFTALLTHRLMQQGVPLVTEPGDGQIEYDVQVIEHGSRVGNTSPVAATELAAGVMVLRDWTLFQQGSRSVIASGLALGALADVSRQFWSGSASGGPTRTEVLVTTTVRLGGQLQHTTSDIYYIDPADLPLYTPPPPLPPPPPPAPTKVWKMVGE